MNSSFLIQQLKNNQDLKEDFNRKLIEILQQMEQEKEESKIENERFKREKEEQITILKEEIDKLKKQTNQQEVDKEKELKHLKGKLLYMKNYIKKLTKKEMNVSEYLNFERFDNEKISIEKIDSSNVFKVKKIGGKNSWDTNIATNPIYKTPTLINAKVTLLSTGNGGFLCGINPSAQFTFVPPVIKNINKKRF